MRTVPVPTTIVLSAALAVLSLSGLSGPARGNTRTVETHFALSADARSEFSTKFPLLSAGRVVIEADWSAKTVSGTPVSLTIVLLRPDGSLGARSSGKSVLRLKQEARDQDIERFAEINEGRWTVKILNDAEASRNEVTGILRITVPASSRTLEDTQFTLLGLGNAQEIPFSVPAPGRIQVNVEWQPDSLSPSPSQVQLVVSLVHPGESRTYARRHGASPVRVEQQITEQELDLGMRWVVRVQNDTQTKVGGTVRVTYAPVYELQ